MTPPRNTLFLSSFFALFLIIRLLFLLGFVHWFGFLSGMRCSRLQLRLLKRVPGTWYTSMGLARTYADLCFHFFSADK